MAALAVRLTALGWGMSLCLLVAGASAEVVVVVSARSTVHSLSETELTDIYLGRTRQLPDGSPVVPMDQKRGSPEFEEFYDEYLARTPAQITAHWSKLIFTGRGQPPQAVSGSRAMADILAQEPHAIGYVDSALADERLRVVPIE